MGNPECCSPAGHVVTSRNARFRSVQTRRCGNRVARPTTFASDRWNGEVMRWESLNLWAAAIATLPLLLTICVWSSLHRLLHFTLLSISIKVIKIEAYDAGSYQTHGEALLWQRCSLGRSTFPSILRQTSFGVDYERNGGRDVHKGCGSMWVHGRALRPEQACRGQ